MTEKVADSIKFLLSEYKRLLKKKKMGSYQNLNYKRLIG